MTTKQLTILNARGIHVRPSALIAQALAGYDGKVTIARMGERPQMISASPLSILSLGLTCGEQITLSVEGQGEGPVCDKLCALFSKHFDFK